MRLVSGRVIAQRPRGWIARPSKGAAGLASDAGFELPLSQDQLADAIGLTPVHVNRTLKSLAADGVVHRDRRYISFSDWDLVRTIGDFNALYLHLDQVKPR